MPRLFRSCRCGGRWVMVMFDMLLDIIKTLYEIIFKGER